MKLQRILTALFLMFVLSCKGEEEPSVSEADYQKTAIATSKYPEKTRLWFEGERLHKEGNWKESSLLLERAYAISSDHSGGVAYYLFINYGMLGNVGIAKKWFSIALAFGNPREKLSEDCSEGKYSKLCGDKKLLDAMKAE